jgi:tetratricopeptide (TPR) repeat protein
MHWLWWRMLAVSLAGSTSGLVPDASESGVVFGTADEAVRSAWADLVAGRFADAARQFQALADASAGVDFRHLEAVSRYEDGQLVRAESTAALGLRADPHHGPLLALQGLIWVDLGRGAGAIELLARAEARARELNDLPLVARALLHRGLAYADLGEDESARRVWEEARELARRAQLPEVAVEAAQQLEGLATERSVDVVGRTAASLRAGDVAGALAGLPEDPTGSRREIARVALARGMVLRASGQPDLAADTLQAAISVATDAGLVREAAAAHLEHARVLRLMAQPEQARLALLRALELVDRSSHRLRHLDVRAALAEQALEAGEPVEAKAQLAVARELAAQVEAPLAVLRVGELEGRLAYAEGRPVDGGRWLGQAAEGWGGQGAWSEAARVATADLRLSLAAGSAASGLRERALGWFARAGDPHGPAHVAIGEGLGLVVAGQLPAALEAFAKAEEAALAAGGGVGERLAVVARANAAEVLRGLGHEQVAAHQDGAALLASHQAFGAAGAAYDLARKDFDARKYGAARRGFEEARRGFEALGEARHALSARRGAAWAGWNEAVAADRPDGLVLLDAVAQEAAALGEGELRVRALTSAAVLAARAKRPDAAERLRIGAKAAEGASLPELAARCWSYLAEVGGTLEERIAAARAAFAYGGRDGAYAMYAVALQAWQGDQPALALALADEVGEGAGDLAGSLEQVREAARAAIGEAAP